MALVLFSMAVWSGWMVVSRFAVKGSLNAYDITALRFTTAGLLLLPMAFKRGLRIGPWGYWSALLLSILGGAAYVNVAIAGMKYAPASHVSTVINGTMFLTITLFGVHGLKETLPRIRLLGVICSCAGIACIFAAKSKGSNPDEWIGHILFIASGFMFGLYTILARAWKIDVFHAVAVVSVISMITYMPVYFALGLSHISLANWHEAAFQAAYQGALTAVLALITFNIAVQILGASHAGAFIPLVPVVSTLLAIPFLHEVPTALEWTGVGAVSLGVFLASGVLQWRPRKKTLEIQ
jgi:drug/metabolite transporter (DMT)-like permease